MSRAPSIAVYYEHPDWFRPLFRELDRRGARTVRVHAAHHRFDPADPARDLGGADLVFNRMSPSAWKRGAAHAVFHTAHWLAALEHANVPVVNGAAIFAFEISKALQVAALARLGVPVPRTRVVNRAEELSEAAAALEFPVVDKPNVGGSGAGIRRFDDARALDRARESGELALGLDGTLLLQEYHPPRGGSIVRVETLEARYLYGIRIHLGGHAGFDLCPADVCRTTDGVAIATEACPVESAKAGLTVERFEPPLKIVHAVERIARATSLDVGGIEYLESERDGQVYFYDVNALSNFVAEGERVVGFDPTARLVEALIERARGAAPVAAERRRA